VAALSYGEAVRRLAERDPDAPAFVHEKSALSRGELERRSNRLARAFAARGVRPGDRVTVELPNGLEHCVACLAAWKLGAVPNPVSPRLPRREREAILARAEPALVVGVDPAEAAGRPALPTGFEPDAALSDAPLPDQVPPHERAMASGGSTGAPKLIVAANPAVYDPDAPVWLFAARRAALVPGPLHHAVPFSAAWQAVFGGAKAVLMSRFDASECLALIERHRVDRVCFVPTMLLRIWRLPEAERLGRDLSSLEFVMTGGAPCPAWLMRAWIDWLGPDVMHEAFGPSERIGGTFITGREWLARPGSVGRPPPGTRLRIADPETGEELPPGRMGEIWSLPAGGPGSTYRYVGAEPRRTPDGFESVGDMGWLDADGYLYLGDRRADMILTGGRNVYPAEVEAALESHPVVRSSAVIGLPDEDLGQRVHAIVEVIEPLPEDELRAHLRDRLVAWKLPRSFEWADGPLRDDAGKLRRSALREARLPRG
jgi:bile acid-coenzyme A ligase